LERLGNLKQEAKNLSSTELNDLVVGFIQDKKGKDIVSLDLRHIPEAVADYFIVCHGDSTTQVRAIADHVEEEYSKEFGRSMVTVEGKSNGEWALVDFSDVVVHIFLNEKREFYQIEDLWSDAKATLYENM
jgi:ribosome-associated protein